VCAVVLTYGDRWRYLERVLRGIAGQEGASVARVALADNGSAYPLRERLAALGGVPPVDLVELGSNTGSAAGYKAALECGVRSGCDYLWMLDDDNLPAPTALRALLDARRGLGDHPDHLFACHRPDRVKYADALSGRKPLSIGEPDSFMNLRAAALPALAWRKLRRGRPAGDPVPAAVREIGYAVYGGLLLSSAWPARVGYPDTGYFLYMDDREYTARIARAGGRIHLVADALVEDLETSWYIATRKSFPVLDASSPEAKAYYSVRNQVAFELKYLVRDPAAYRLNRAVLMPLLFLRALAFNRSLRRSWKRMRLVRLAVADALAGRMGQKPFPAGGPGPGR
jgi:GT2 family glycosyltransferase